MSTMAKSAREAMKAKARRLSAATGPDKVDGSSWSPSEPLDAEAKTGMRPISRRAYKAGGTVDGDDAKKHAGKSPRGGGEASRIANDLANQNVKDANQERAGKKHVGGFSTGGDVALGLMSPAGLALKSLIGKAGGGRAGRAAGGRTNGKTNINIIIAPGSKGEQPPAPADAMPPPPMMPPRAPTPPMMPPGGPPMGGLPTGGPPGMGAPPMMRATGGRTVRTGNRSYYDMKGGGGSGLGRLEKIDEYGGR